MIDEITNPTSYEMYKLNSPLEATKNLENAIKITFSVDHTFREKEAAIDDFQDTTRNACLSTESKATIGVVVGALIGAAVFFSALCPVLGAFAIAFVPGWVLAGFGGGMLGYGAGLMASAFQDDRRGQAVHDNLAVLNKTRLSHSPTLFRAEVRNHAPVKELEKDGPALTLARA
jgi:hypothetical protein